MTDELEYYINISLPDSSHVWHAFLLALNRWFCILRGLLGLDSYIYIYIFQVVKEHNGLNMCCWSFNWNSWFNIFHDAFHIWKILFNVQDKENRKEVHGSNQRYDRDSPYILWNAPFISAINTFSKFTYHLDNINFTCFSIWHQGYFTR